MGLIYLITCDIIPDQYIGQTNSSIQTRWSRHIACAKRMIKYRDQPDKIRNIYHSYLYRAMAKHGIETFHVQVIEDGIFYQDLLDAAEIQYISEFNTQAPNGLNLLSGGGSNTKQSNVTIQIMREKKQLQALNNRNTILDGLPALTTYKNDHLGERILINSHPLCKSKTFSVKTYGSITAVKEEVIKFLAELETTGIVYTPVKIGEDMRKYPGFIVTPKGFRVNKVYKCTTYDKRFERKDRTREENKQAATEWYFALLQRLNINL